MHTATCPRTRRRAFTLLELIVVIVVLGILAALAIPTFQNSIDRSGQEAVRTTLASVHREVLAVGRFDGDPAVTRADLDDVAGDLPDASASGVSATPMVFVAVAADGAGPGTVPATGQIGWVITDGGATLALATPGPAGSMCYSHSSGSSKVITWCAAAPATAADAESAALTPPASGSGDPSPTSTTAPTSSTSTTTAPVTTTTTAPPAADVSYVTAYYGKDDAATPGGSKLAYSADGETWAFASTPWDTTGGNIQDIAYGNGTWVAVGRMTVNSTYKGVVLTSTDGRTWVDVPGTFPAQLHAVAYGNGRFVAVGTQGTVVYSDTPAVAASWTSVNVGATSTLENVAFGNGVWVSYLWRSTDNGQTWTRYTPPFNGVYKATAFDGTRFVTVPAASSSTDEGKVVTSPDAAAWTVQPRVTVLAGSADWQRLTIDGGVHIATRSGSSGTGELAWSTDGTTWTRVQTSISANCSTLNDAAVTDAGDWLVTCGRNNGTSGALLYRTSDRGVTWTPVSGPTVGMFTGAIAER